METAKADNRSNQKRFWFRNFVQSYGTSLLRSAGVSQNSIAVKIGAVNNRLRFVCFEKLKEFSLFLCKRLSVLNRKSLSETLNLVSVFKFPFGHHSF